MPSVLRVGRRPRSRGPLGSWLVHGCLALVLGGPSLALAQAPTAPAPAKPAEPSTAQTPAQAPTAPTAPSPASDPAQTPPPQAPAASPPKGPADIIGGAQRAAQKKELEQSQAAASAAPDPKPPTAPSPSAGANPHATSPVPARERRPLTRARADTSVPTGSIRVLVVDDLDRPVPSAAVRIGVMASDGSRESLDAKTDASGVALFHSLDVGDRNAYRVNVPYKGATYSSTPFRLPHEGGFDVSVRRLSVTRQDKDVVLYVGATSVELKEERLKVVQQVRLVNVGSKTYLFPEEGTLVRLPKGFTAFQAGDHMGDQKMNEASEEGMRLTGSLPPGQVTLLWGFDLLRDGDEAEITLPIPWTTIGYRVVTDAAQGMSLDVPGFPEPQLHRDRGRSFFVTESQRRIGEPPLRSITIKLKGLPGPGPARWIALALALAALGLFAFLAFRPSEAVREAEARGDLDEREAILAEVLTLERERLAGEVGERYHRERKAQLLDALAAVLRREALSGPKG